MIQSNNPLLLVLERIVNFFLLNLLWIIICLPIVTIFPATAAMFAVIRSWILKKDYSDVFRPFFYFFKQNFKQSLLTGISWFIAAIILFINLQITIFYHEQNFIKFFVLPLLFTVSILFTMTTVFLFPVMVQYKLKWVDVIIRSFYLSINQFLITLICLFTILTSYLLFLKLPITILITFSATAYVIITLCQGFFNKLFKKNKNKLKTDIA